MMTLRAFSPHRYGIGAGKPTANRQKSADAHSHCSFMTVASFSSQAARFAVLSCHRNVMTGEFAMTMLLFAGALLSQASVMSVPHEGGLEKVDVAYEALAEGRTDAAIAQLRAEAGNDPAALINLGSAYARKGMRQEAMDCFNAAIASSRQYELQLADGSWMNSRHAARVAAARLERTGALAARR
jgi:tetratricopeptide (TPR) repeat protein